ncbi:hypothetical protein DAPPUDRAFT_258527 [Daphnia pulex]|uniref:Uncharacterized protein n=1 Tax=Daphnia pulex TaxID=6669 RepID=E9HFJ6_DAPPU|nr:hypothetical protein DAPPUDRAFT_258527 [Daphnia pulex]|eukprot:EFX69444.1 hypothetical protein DAPPUDRAFT_258527 [Daphnia pulex]
MTEKGFEPLPPKRLVPNSRAIDHSATLSLLKLFHPFHCIKIIPSLQILREIFPFLELKGIPGSLATTTIADNSRNVAGHGHSRAGVNALIQRGKTEVRGRGRARGGIRINGGRGCGNSNCPTTTLPSNYQDEVEETDRLAWSGKDPAQYANNEENAEDGKGPCNKEDVEDRHNPKRKRHKRPNHFFKKLKP